MHGNGLRPGAHERDLAAGDIRAVVGGAIDVQVAVGAGAAAIGVVEEVDADLVIARGPVTAYRDRVGLTGRMRGVSRQGAADLLAVHRNGILRVTLVGVLADLQHQLVRSRADARRGVGRVRRTRRGGSRPCDRVRCTGRAAGCRLSRARRA